MYKGWWDQSVSSGLQLIRGTCVTVYNIYIFNPTLKKKCPPSYPSNRRISTILVGIGMRKLFVFGC